MGFSLVMLLLIYLFLHFGCGQDLADNNFSVGSVEFSPSDLINSASFKRSEGFRLVVNAFSHVFHVKLFRSSITSPSAPCHFEGFVQDYENSNAAFSLCSLKESTGIISFDHRFYLLMNPCITNSLCKKANQFNFTAVGDLNTLSVQKSPRTEIAQLIRQRRGLTEQSFAQPDKLFLRGENADTLYIRLIIASDYKQHSNNNNIRSNTERRALQIANVAALLMRPLNIVLYVMGHHFLDKDDVYANSRSEMLSKISKYKISKIESVRKDIDVLHVLTSAKFDDDGSTDENSDLLGQAYVSGICSIYGASFSADLTNSAIQVGATMAHEIGHLLGLSHDRSNCTCPFSELISEKPRIDRNSNKCIMIAAKGVSGSQPLAWSNCSVKAMENIRQTLPPYCLKQRPTHSSKISRHCGNGVVEPEEGEECDCGAPELLEVWAAIAIDNEEENPPCSLKCCDMNSCRFVSKNATCATGSCCNFETCQFSPHHTECRKAITDCDLPEYCDGKSEYCPRDLHKATGYSCTPEEDGLEKGLCFAGRCNTRDKQCRQIWGNGTNSGGDECYNRNRGGGETANCGHERIIIGDDVQYQNTKCQSLEDAYCGTLQCSGLAEETKPISSIGSRNYHPDRGCAYFIGDMTPDSGLVLNGTQCKPLGDSSGKGICINHQCVALNQTDIIIQATLEAEGLGHLRNRIPNSLDPIGDGCGCLKDRCVCNSVGSRHCLPGWEPPLCESSGCGGSLESNSAGLCSRADSGLSTGATIAIVVFVLVLVLAMIAVIIILVIGRRRLADMWYSSRLFVQVEYLRDRLTPVRPSSGGGSHSPLRRQPNSSTGLRRSLRGPPGPAPLPVVSANDNSIEMKFEGNQRNGYPGDMLQSNWSPSPQRPPRGISAPNSNNRSSPPARPPAPRSAVKQAETQATRSPPISRMEQGFNDALKSNQQASVMQRDPVLRQNGSLAQFTPQ